MSVHDDQNEYNIGPKAEKFRQRLYSKSEEEKPLTKDEEKEKIISTTGHNISDVVLAEEERLHALLAHGCRLVGNVESAALLKEVESLTKEEDDEQIWKKVSLEDSHKTDELIRQVHKGWQRAQHLIIAEDLQESFQSIQEISDELVKQKKALVESLLKQLEVADSSFRSDRLIYSQQRTQLVSRITEHVHELVVAYQESLRKAKSSAWSEKQKLFEFFTEELDKSTNTLDHQLYLLMRTRANKKAERIEQLVNIKVHGLPNAQNGIHSDKDLEKVLLELYRMRTRKLIEEQQLQFNFVTLQEQLKETTALVSEGRRKVNALRPTVANLRKRCKEKESKRLICRRQQLEKFSEKKQHLKELKIRLAEASEISSQQIRGIAYLQYTELEDLITQVFELDRSISLVVLSKDHVDPDYSPLQELHPAFEPQDTPALEVAARVLQGDILNDFDSDPLTHEIEECFLRSITNAAKFIISTPFQTDQDEEKAQLLSLEHIFWELGIKTEDDIEAILSSARAKHFAKLQYPQLSRSPDDYHYGTEYVQFSTEEVLEVLVNLCRNRSALAQKIREQVQSLTPSEIVSSCPPSRPGLDEKWESLVNDVTDHRNKSWKIICNALEIYHQILKERADELQKSEALHRQNVELIFLLSNISRNSLNQ